MIESQFRKKLHRLLVEARVQLPREVVIDLIMDEVEAMRGEIIRSYLDETEEVE